MGVASSPKRPICGVTGELEQGRTGLSQCYLPEYLHSPLYYIATLDSILPAYIRCFMPGRCLLHHYSLINLPSKKHHRSVPSFCPNTTAMHRSTNSPNVTESYQNIQQISHAPNQFPSRWDGFFFK